MAKSTQLYANNARSTIASNINTTDTQIIIAAGNGVKYPSPISGQYFLATIEAGNSIEIVKVINRTVDTFTLDPAGRGQEGTVPASWSAGASISMRVTRDTLTRFARYQDRLADIVTVDALDPPVSSDGNSYITRSIDDTGSAVVAYRQSDFKWSFPNFPSIYLTGSVTAANQVATVSIASGGTGYVNGNTLTISGGTGVTAAIITVTSVSGGVITGIVLTNAGLYTVNPAATAATTGGAGTGATINLTFQSANTTTTAVSTTITTALQNFTSGRYVVQFTSGLLQGFSRLLTSTTTNSIGWAAATSSVPQVGDNFTVFRSIASQLIDPVFNSLTVNNAVILGDNVADTIVINSGNITLNSMAASRVLLTDTNKKLTYDLLTYNAGVLNNVGGETRVSGTATAKHIVDSSGAASSPNMMLRQNGTTKLCIGYDNTLNRAWFGITETASTASLYFDSSGNPTTQGTLISKGNMVVGTTGLNALTVNASAITWNNPIHTSNHTFTGQINVGGYAYANYFNQTSPNNEATPVSQIITTNGTDAFFRKTGLPQLASALRHMTIRAILDFNETTTGGWQRVTINNQFFPNDGGESLFDIGNSLTIVAPTTGYYFLLFSVELSPTNSTINMAFVRNGTLMVQSTPSRNNTTQTIGQLSYVAYLAAGDSVAPYIFAPAGLTIFGGDHNNSGTYVCAFRLY